MYTSVYVYTILLNVHLAYKVYKCTWNSFVALYYPCITILIETHKNKTEKKNKENWMKQTKSQYICTYVFVNNIYTQKGPWPCVYILLKFIAGFAV